MNKFAFFAVIITGALIPLVLSTQADIPQIDVEGGFNFVNTDGNRHPKGASLEAGLAGPVRYYRKASGEARIGFFGGLIEAIVLTNNLTNQTFMDIYNNRIVEYSPSLRGYVEIMPSDNVKPSPRSYACGGYDVRTNRFYMYGGTNAPAQGEALTPANIFNDLWTFDFTTSKWHQLTTTGPNPGDRASMGCATNGTSLFLYSGACFDCLFNASIGDFNPNDLWALQLPATTSGNPFWVRLRAPGNNQLPPGRTQPACDRFPGNTKFVVMGGDRFVLPSFTRVTQDNLFTYDWLTDTVGNLSSANSPQPPLTQNALVGVSPKVFLTTNGDEQGNLTLADTCSNAAFVCTFPNSQVNRTFTYNIHKQKYNELIFGPDHEFPATRRSNLAAYVEMRDGSTELIDTYWENPESFDAKRIDVIFNGGYGFNGQPDGTGEIRNTGTFLWRVPLNFF